MDISRRKFPDTVVPLRIVSATWIKVENPSQQIERESTQDMRNFVIVVTEIFLPYSDLNQVKLHLDGDRVCIKSCDACWMRFDKTCKRVHCTRTYGSTYKCSKQWRWKLRFVEWQQLTSQKSISNSSLKLFYHKVEIRKYMVKLFREFSVQNYIQTALDHVPVIDGY